MSWLISQKEPPEGILPVPRSHLGELPLKELRLQLEEVEIEIESLTAQRQALTRYLYLLNAHLADADNQAMLNTAATQTLDGEQGSCCYKDGFLSNQIDAVDDMARELGFAYVIEKPAPHEQPPTFIEQPEKASAGAELAVFYQVPNYHSWDPSVVLMGFLCIVFRDDYGRCRLWSYFADRHLLFLLSHCQTNTRPSIP